MIGGNFINAEEILMMQRKVNGCRGNFLMQRKFFDVKEILLIQRNFFDSKEFF